MKRWSVSLLCTLLSGWIAGASFAAPIQSDEDSPAALAGLSASQAYEIEDDVPLDLENEYLLRLLYRIPKVSVSNLKKYAGLSTEVDRQQLQDSPRKYRLWIFALEGRVKSVTRYQMGNAPGDGGMSGIHLVDLVDSRNGLHRVATRSIPSAWQGEGWQDQPARALGFFFQWASQSGGEPSVPVYVVSRMEWYPDRVGPQVKDAQVSLAAKGMNIGLFDSVKAQNTRPLGGADAEAFYQMLAAVADSKPQDLPAVRADFFDLVEQPLDHFGSAVSITGRVRRCVPISVDDAETRSLLGRDRYYELDMFVPLDGQEIVIRDANQKKLKYQHRFPVTVCVADLGGRQPSEIEDQMCTVDGYFFRFWMFQNEFTTGSGGQVSPLIIALAPTPVENSARLLDQLLLLILVGVLLGALALIFWLRRGDRRSSERVRRSVNELPEKVDLSGID